MRINKTNWLGSLTAGCMALGVCCTAASADGTTAQPAAADSSPGALEEVIVTSQRRAERLQDVPISVSAFSPEKLDAQGLRDIDDLTLFSPGVSFVRMGLTAASNYNDENSDIAFRGIDSNAGTSTTAIYVDDTPIQGRHIGFGTVIPFPVLFDLERVEVLRGPQGTLFGASAEGGALRFITPQPSLNTYSGYMRGELATTDHGGQSYEAGVGIGGPVIDGKLGFRMSAQYRQDGGYVDRADYRTGVVSQPNANWQYTASLRLAFKWAVTDNLSITPSVYLQRLHLNDTGSYWPQLSDPGAERFLNGNAQRNPSTDPFTLSAVKLDWDLGPVQLIGNVSYFSRRQWDVPDYTQFDRANYGLSPYAAYGVFAESFFHDNQDNTVAEVRLQSKDSEGPLSWTGGVYYAHLNENELQDIYDPHLNDEFNQAYPQFAPYCTDAAPCPNGLIAKQPVFRIIDKQIAGYGEATVKLGHGFSVTGGVRVEHASYNGLYEQYGPFLGPAFGPTTPLVSAGADSATPITPRAVINYKPNRDTMFYASAAKGYREGGINNGLGVTCISQEQQLGLGRSPGTYRPDSLWSYELGAKITTLDYRMQINASLFYIDWKDIQQNLYLTSCGQQFVANLGKANSKGGDIDIQYRPVDKLSLQLQAAYTNAQYTQTVCFGGCAPGGNLVTKGDRLPSAPWTVTVSSEYQLPVWTARAPYVRLDYHVTTDPSGKLSIQNPANGAADATLPDIPGFSTLGLRAGLRFDGFDVSVFGQNLTNSHPLLVRSRDTTGSPLYFDRSIRPLTVGATATYRF
ncbi:MAG: TonB-dependent receptor [Proteobacteria bacterium]|nr:TonB-dependent receptor [Pseudomonadota bacterium]